MRARLRYALDRRPQPGAALAAARDAHVTHLSYCIICPIFSTTACGNRNVSCTI
jgi:hypothetical protein